MGALKHFFTAALGLAIVAKAAASRPNIVLIMTDDQDKLLDSLEYQPAVKANFAEQGTTFQKHYCTISQCCPSRVSLLTGKAAHNTNVTDIMPPYGGYPKFANSTLNDNYLPVWLQSQGYNTFYAGKLMNSHSVANYDNPYLHGWTGSDFLLDPGTYIYYNATMQRNQDAPVSYDGSYSTDLIANKSIELLQEAKAASQPFFLGVTPIGPHSQVVFSLTSDQPPVFEPPVPAIRHQDLYPNVTVPRTPNFNPNVSSGASYILSLDQLNDTAVTYNDNFYRLRLQALAGVDDLVTTVISSLKELDLLDDTYIIYTSDNGYHIGQHRLSPGKSCGIEEDINVPFFIRGPGIPANVIVDYPTSHTDLVPTIFSLAGIPLHDDFDGVPMPLPYPSSSVNSSNRTEHINIEFWGTQIQEGLAASPFILPNNTYKGLRIVSPDNYDLAYFVWCTNEHELYNMQSDQWQMNNLYDQAGQVNGWDIGSCKLD